MTPAHGYFPTAPDAAPLPRPVTEAGPARRLRDAIEPLGAHAFWNRLTNQRNLDLGLDRFSGYVWGRAAALGEPPAELVVSAFAWFEPVSITVAYERGRSTVARAEMVQGRDQTTAESLGGILSGADLEPAIAILRRGLAAADGIGRPLFSGLRSRPWPEPAVGRLWRACDLLREHRGDSHIAACIAAGFGALEMNFLTELWLDMTPVSYSATRRWSEARLTAAVADLEDTGLVAGGTLTESGRSVRDEIEARTDALEKPILDAIGGDLEWLLEQLEPWSQAVVSVGAFSPDPRKRAAG